MTEVIGTLKLQHT